MSVFLNWLKQSFVLKTEKARFNEDVGKLSNNFQHMIIFNQNAFIQNVTRCAVWSTPVYNLLLVYWLGKELALDKTQITKDLDILKSNTLSLYL